MKKTQRLMYMLWLPLIAILPTPLIVQADEAGKAQWPQHGYDNSARGLSPYAGAMQDKELWRFRTFGWIESIVVGHDGTVYAAGGGGYLYAISPDGKEKWRFDWRPDHTDFDKLSEPQQDQWRYGVRVNSTAVARNGTVYLGLAAREEMTLPATRYLVALDTAGQELWRYEVGDMDISSLLLLGPDDTVYFGAQGEDAVDFIALRPDGKPRWRRRLGDGYIGSAALGENGVIYVGGTHLFALSAADGSNVYPPVENIKSPMGNYSPAIGADGSVYIASNRNGGMLKAFSPRLKPKWSTALGFMEMTPAIDGDGTIYVHTWPKPGSPPGKLYAIDPQDGAEKWELDVTGSDSSPVVDKNGVLYFGSDSGHVYAVQTSDGSLLWRREIGGEFDDRPAMASDGTLYIGHSGGAGAGELEVDEVYFYVFAFR